MRRRSGRGRRRASSRVLSPPKNRSARLTIGLKCAPDTEPKARISATSPPAVAVEFSSSCRPTSSGERRCGEDPRADHDRDQEAGADGLGGDLAGRGSVGSRASAQAPRTSRSASSRSGTTVQFTQRPSFSLVISPASASTDEVVAHRRLALADRLLEIAAARRALGRRRDQREQPQPNRVGQRLERSGQLDGLRPRDERRREQRSAARIDRRDLLHQLLLACIDSCRYIDVCP